MKFLDRIKKAGQEEPKPVQAEVAPSPTPPPPQRKDLLTPRQLVLRTSLSDRRLSGMSDKYLENLLEEHCLYLHTKHAEWSKLCADAVVRQETPVALIKHKSPFPQHILEFLSEYNYPLKNGEFVFPLRYRYSQALVPYILGSRKVYDTAFIDSDVYGVLWRVFGSPVRFDKRKVANKKREKPVNSKLEELRKKSAELGGVVCLKNT